MNKFLRYAFASFMAMLVGSAMAAPITFDPTTDLGSQASSSTGADEVTKDGITISASPTGSFGNGQQYRVYKDATFTVKSTVGTITQMVITCTASDQEKYGPGNFSNVSTGEFTVSGKTGTWTGSATEFSMVATGSQVRMTKIEVYLDGETPPVNPDPDPDPDPVEATVFDFDNQANILFPGMGRSSGTGSNYVPDGEFNETTTSTVVNGATVTVEPSPADASTRNRLWASSPVLRLYNGSFSVNASKNIKNMVITVGWNSNNQAVTWNTGNTVSTGTLTIGNKDDQTVKWTGDAKDITFTIAANTQIKKIEFSYDAVETKLEISGTTPFLGKTTVTITPSNSNYIVYYTLDGSDPSDDSSNYFTYSAPFELTETTTVKAVEEDALGNLSEVVEKTFVKEEIPEAENIAALKALSNNTDATLKLNNAQVLYVGTNDMYVRDETGAIDFFKLGLPFTAGNILNGKVSGKFQLYQDTPELVKTDATNANDVTVTTGTAQPKDVTLSELLASGETYYCDLVKLTNVTLDSIQVGENANKQLYAFVGNDKINVYDKFQLSKGKTIDLTKTYTFSGIILPYNDELEICPIETLSTTETPIIEVNSIGELITLGKGVEAKLNLEGAVVTKNFTTTNGNNSLYLRDASGSLLFYNVFNKIGLAAEPAVGDQVDGSIVVTLDIYNNLPEAKAIDGKTNSDELIVSGSGTTPEPVEITLAEISDNLNEYVVVKDVTITKDDGSASAPGRAMSAVKYFANDGSGNKVQIYNNFHEDEFNDSELERLIGEEKYDIKGIITVFKTDYELYLMEIVPAATGIDNVTAETLDGNAPLYNIAGQQVNKSYKGVVIQNGKKFILK